MFGNNGSFNFLGGNPYSTSKFSLNGILGGLNKSLNFANQAIPLYQKTRPLFKNAGNLFALVKEFRTNDKKNTSVKEVNEFISKPTQVSSSGPQFFI